MRPGEIQPTTRRGPLYAVPVFMAIGIGLAAYLAIVKLSDLYIVDFKSSCTQSQTVDCTAVQKSDYSTVLGVPLSIWAIGTYLAMIALGWLGLRNDPKEDPENPGHAVLATDLLLLVSGLTTLFSVYLVWIQKTKIGASCPFCYGMYAAQAGVFVAAFFASPNRLRGLASGLSAISAPKVVFPALVAFAVGTGGALLWYVREEVRLYHQGSEQAISSVRDLMDEKKYTEAIEALGKLTDRRDDYGQKARRLLDTAFSAQLASDGVDFGSVPAVAAAAAPVEAAPVGNGGTAVSPAAANAVAPAAAPAAAVVAAPSPRPPSGNPAVGKASGKLTDLGWSVFESPITVDDFVHGNPDAPVTIIEFADFECGYCKMLSENLKTVRTKWHDQVRFVFKFYPMDGSCNPRMGGERMHPEACIAARAAYCAGKQGKFWEAHDKLFTMQKSNQEEKLLGYMTELGVEPDAWKTCFNSPAPLQRITNDIRVAAMAGINGTPRMYINNRLVSGASSVSIIEYYIQKALEAPPAAAGVAAAPVAAVPTDASPMVEVSTTKGKVFVDRYEASIDQAGKAVSLPNVRSGQTSWFEAKAACEKAGKRLCSEEEWASACTGTAAVDDNANGWFNDDTIEGNRYPYGAFYEAGFCHDDQETLTGGPVNTGSKTQCVTKAGIFDLAGNLSEWIENDQERASLVGGNFGTGEGAACNQRGTMFGPGLRNNTTGFRCCADTMVPNASSDSAALAAAPGDLLGKPVPEFSIKASDGTDVNAGTWKGKVSYITFFASWCGSCKRELPEVAKWQTELEAKGFQVVAIGVDQAQAQSENFVKQHAPDATFKVALDPDATAMTQFDIAAMPTSFIVDKEGVIRRRIVGFKSDEVPELKAFIEKLF
ncbi:MAG: redoxin family protein [Myxococcales bacterium]|nr:redoxin family protein [Myxococcales bacterium]